MSINEQEARVIRALKSNFPYFAKNILKITTKAAEIIPFELNTPQNRLHDALEALLKKRGKLRVIIVKGRQLGCSTYVQGRFFWKLYQATKPVKAFILTHREEATQSLFDMTKRFWELDDTEYRPQLAASSAKQLVFQDSKAAYHVSTAGASEVGRGMTLQYWHGCLSPESWIMTEGGARRMKDFEVGDMVLTHTGVKAPITFISRKESDAYAVKIMGSNEPLIATGEHKFITRSGKVKLSDMSVGDEVMHPISKIGDEVISWPYRLNYGRKPGRGGSGSIGPDTLEATFELGRILGLYLAEGHQRDNRVTFTVHEREVDRTLEWLAPFSDCWRKVSVERRPSSKTVNITINSKSFSEFILKMCGRTTDKHMPTDWHCNKDFALGIVAGYFSGDGGFDKNTRRVCAPSVLPSIAFSMRDALASLGFGWASLTYRKGAVRHGRTEQAQWTVKLCGDGANRLAELMGREISPYRVKKVNLNYSIEDGAVWLPITSINSVGNIPVMDFEVGHEDHSYRTWQCATSNSEVAFWQKAETHVASLQQTIGDMPGSEIILESTADGVGNLFHRYTMAAVRKELDFDVVFIPWFWSDEYKKQLTSDVWGRQSEDGSLPGMPEEWRNYGHSNKLSYDQVYWAYCKNKELAASIGESSEKPCWKFKQEYPCSLTEAFQTSGNNSFIRSELVSEARKPNPHITPHGRIVLGVDVARGADQGQSDGDGTGNGSSYVIKKERKGDKVGIIDRQGRVMGAKVSERFDPEGDMDYVATRIIHWIDRIRPDEVNIDATGMGVGLVDILRSRGYGKIVNPINFASSALERGQTGPKYADRRAEMWDKMREWLSDGEVIVPDDDGLQADICAPVWSNGSQATHQQPNGALRLESKEKIKARLGYSPDLGDAAALTFAFPYNVAARPQFNQYVAPRVRSGRKTGY